jgi:hypothetical protein
MEVAQHSHAVSPSTSFPHVALLPKHGPHASAARQGFPLAADGTEPSNQLEATDTFPNGSMAQQYKISAGDSESTGQQSNEESFQCLHDAAAGKFWALVQLNEEIETAIEELSSMCLDAAPRKPSAPASFESCLTRLRQDPSLCSEASSTERAHNTEGGLSVHDLHPIQEGAGLLGDRDKQGACTCTCTCANACNSKIMRGLLGESVDAIKAVHEALKEIEDVHCSDELMHFEFCGPFWELSEV